MTALGQRRCFTEQVDLTLCKMERNGTTSPQGYTVSQQVTPPLLLVCAPAASNSVILVHDDGTPWSS